jgi:glyoxylase-like metal-dependent hydrolase (beta-lactamase superfamily II)
MNVECFTVNPFQENTYLLTEGKNALLIDPGFATANEFRNVQNRLQEKNIELKAVLLTHAHIDHIYGLHRVLDYFDVPVYLSHSDLHLWENFYSQATLYGVPARPFDFTPNDYPENGIFDSFGFRLLVLPTPGHSPDHVSLYAENDGFVIAGDALFQGSIGRTDLYKGDFDELATSIKSKLYVLPDATRVLPGHGPETTIGYEKKNNPFVKA